MRESGLWHRGGSQGCGGGGLLTSLPLRSQQLPLLGLRPHYFRQQKCCWGRWSPDLPPFFIAGSSLSWGSSHTVSCSESAAGSNKSPGGVVQASTGGVVQACSDAEQAANPGDTEQQATPGDAEQQATPDDAEPMPLSGAGVASLSGAGVASPGDGKLASPGDGKLASLGDTGQGRSRPSGVDCTSGPSGGNGSSGPSGGDGRCGPSGGDGSSGPSGGDGRCGPSGGDGSSGPSGGDSRRGAHGQAGASESSTFSPGGGGGSGR
ncbi:UNVERIFIED_CONTAM: hypothetical protein FKN15_005674 [Acipenser sinensis]